MGEEPDAMTPGGSAPAERAEPDEPAEIRANIERTRAEMSETIDAIQEKLSPDRLKEQAKDAVKEATVGKVKTMVTSATETASDVVETVQDSAQEAVRYVRENPLPAAIVGAGVAWLLMRSRGEGSRTTYRQPAPRMSSARGVSGSTGSYASRGSYVSPSAYATPGSYAGEGYDVRRGMRPDERTGGDWLALVKDNPVPATLFGLGISWLLMNRGRATGYGYQRDPYSRAYDAGRSGISEATRQTREAVGDVAEKVQESWQHYSTRAETEFDRWMRENPLTVGVAAVALGAAVGLSVPRTQTEDAWMGEARDTLVERANEVAEDTVQQAEKMASEVTGQQGTSPSSSGQQTQTAGQTGSQQTGSQQTGSQQTGSQQTGSQTTGTQTRQAGGR